MVLTLKMVVDGVYKEFQPMDGYDQGIIWVKCNQVRCHQSPSYPDNGSWDGAIW